MYRNWPIHSRAWVAIYHIPQQQNVWEYKGAMLYKDQYLLSRLFLWSSIYRSAHLYAYEVDPTTYPTLFFLCTPSIFILQFIFIKLRKRNPFSFTRLITKRHFSAGGIAWRDLQGETPFCVTCFSSVSLLKTTGDEHGFLSF